MMAYIRLFEPQVKSGQEGKYFNSPGPIALPDTTKLCCSDEYKFNTSTGTPLNTAKL